MPDESAGLKLENLGVGDCVWFVLKDGLVREGQVSAFFHVAGHDPAVKVFDMTEKKHRYMQPAQLSRHPLGDIKKKRRSKKKK